MSDAPSLHKVWGHIETDSSSSDGSIGGRYSMQELHSMGIVFSNSSSDSMSGTKRDRDGARQDHGSSSGAPPSPPGLLSHLAGSFQSMTDGTSVAAVPQTTAGAQNPHCGDIPIQPCHAKLAIFPGRSCDLCLVGPLSGSCFVCHECSDHIICGTCYATDVSYVLWPLGDHTFTERPISQVRSLPSSVAPRPAAGNRGSSSSGVPTGSQTARNSISIDEDELEQSPLLSLGSIAHSLGTCQPCHYNNVKVGCRNGKKCGLCHFAHPRTKRRSAREPDDVLGDTSGKPGIA